MSQPTSLTNGTATNDTHDTNGTNGTNGTTSLPDQPRPSLERAFAPIPSQPINPTPSPAHITNHPILLECLSGNNEWREGLKTSEEGFFERNKAGQRPFLLWIGCSDSRVPESIVLGRYKPGDIFVHRNIANQFNGGDDSCQAVLEYGVGHLGIKHVVVVGHTACGGCAAAWNTPPAAANQVADESAPPLKKVIQPLIDLRHTLPEGATFEDFIVANVRKGVEEVAAHPVIQKKWEDFLEDGDKGEAVYIHGWLKDLSDGSVKDLGISRGPGRKGAPLPSSGA